MLPVVQVGPLAIQTPGLILIAGLWSGLTLAERHAVRYGLKAELLDNLVLFSLIGGIIGGRLGYIIQYPSAFFGNLISIFSLNPGLLDFWTGLAAALVVAIIFGQRKHLSFWATLDALTPAFTILAVALGFSHLASWAAFGMQTDVPWSISMWGTSRHPSQVYEILAASTILVLLWPVKGVISKKLPAESGLYFMTFVALSAAARLFLEAFRGDSHLIFAGVRQAQLIAWLVLAASLWEIGRKKSDQGKPVHENGFEIQNANHLEVP